MTNWKDGVVSTEAINRSFFCKLSVFAVVSGLWNVVVIYTDVAGDPSIKRSDIVSFLWRGHVGDEILDKFPLIKTSLQGMASWIPKYHADAKLRENTGPFRDFGRTVWSFVRYFAKLLVLGPVLVIPFGLTCWVGLHLLLLNLVLGVLIGLGSLRLAGAQVLPGTGYFSPPWFAFILLGIAWLSNLFRTAYYSAETKRWWVEAFGHWFFLVLLFVFYTRLSVRWLALALIVQQIIANVFIFSFFMVPKNDLGRRGRRTDADVIDDAGVNDVK
jgi:hypothetical protein